MSDEHKELYDQGRSTMYSSSYDSQAFDPSYMSFTECLQMGAMDYNSFASSFALSPSTILTSSADQTQKPSEDADCGGGSRGGETPVLTQNSSLSSSSDHGAEEDSGKNTVDDHSQAKGEEEAERSKKGKKGKKKGEKKEKEPRFAFMTKSEVDQLEDGYRWRKYGQKAVKNSPYPRSYYRCTTQKCTVKKRVERSFEDPTTVITTYEGQHNHPVPTSLRGNYNSAAAMFTPSLSSSSSSSSSVLSPLTMMIPSMASPQDLLLLHSTHGGSSNINNNSSLYYSHNYANPNSIQYHHHQLPSSLPDHHDDGLLQDLIPSSMFFKQEPRHD